MRCSAGRAALKQFGFLARFVNVALFMFMVAAAPAAATEPVKILMLGDSLTAGYGLIKGESLPAQLEAALRADEFDARVVNGGVSGDTTAGGWARLPWSMADGADVLIVALGANDGLRGLPTQETEANLDAIIRGAKTAGVPVLLLGMQAPPNLGSEYGADFDAVFPRLAARHGVAFYPFLLKGVAARPELNQDDGIHPNAEGVAVVVGKILPFVRELIEQARH